MKKGLCHIHFFYCLLAQSLSYCGELVGLLLDEMLNVDSTLHLLALHL